MVAEEDKLQAAIKGQLPLHAQKFAYQGDGWLSDHDRKNNQNDHLKPIDSGDGKTVPGDATTRDASTCDEPTTDVDGSTTDGDAEVVSAVRTTAADTDTTMNHATETITTFANTATATTTTTAATALVTTVDNMTTAADTGVVGPSAQSATGRYGLRLRTSQVVYTEVDPVQAEQAENDV